jgi:hypothetical protein
MFSAESIRNENSLSRILHSLQTQWEVMNEERTEKCVWQVEHICGHLWHIYSTTVNQVMVATVKLSKWLLQLYVLSGVRVTRSLVLSVCFVGRCSSFCTSSFGHCVVYSSSIYRFLLPLWYKSWTKKGPGSVYDKWDISVVIWDTDIPQRSTKSWWRP